VGFLLSARVSRPRAPSQPRLSSADSAHRLALQISSLIPRIKQIRSRVFGLIFRRAPNPPKATSAHEPRIENVYAGSIVFA
jgi:hypothetical protein